MPETDDIRPQRIDTLMNAQTAVPREFLASEEPAHCPTDERGSEDYTPDPDDERDPFTIDHLFTWSGSCAPQGFSDDEDVRIPTPPSASVAPSSASVSAQSEDVVTKSHPAVTPGTPCEKKSAPETSHHDHMCGYVPCLCGPEDSSIEEMSHESPSIKDNLLLNRDVDNVGNSRDIVNVAVPAAQKGVPSSFWSDEVSVSHNPVPAVSGVPLQHLLEADVLAMLPVLREAPGSCLVDADAGAQRLGHDHDGGAAPARVLPVMFGGLPNRLSVVAGQPDADVEDYLAAWGKARNRTREVAIRNYCRDLYNTQPEEDGSDEYWHRRDDWYEVLTDLQRGLLTDVRCAKARKDYRDKKRREGREVRDYYRGGETTQPTRFETPDDRTARSKRESRKRRNALRPVEEIRANERERKAKQRARKQAEE